MPNSSCTALAIGARQFVVQDALEITVCFSASYWSSLTPITIVMSSCEAGAEMITFLAPPSMCALALVASVKKPVDSTTMSAPTDGQSILAGSRSSNTVIFLPSTVIEVSS